MSERIPQALADRYAAITAHTVCDHFGIAVSTGQNKSRALRNPLKIGPMSPEWTLPSRLEDNPMVWMLVVNGLMIDIRRAPIELQRAAFRQGLIPYVPAERGEPATG